MNIARKTRSFAGCMLVAVCLLWLSPDAAATTGKKSVQKSTTAKAASSKHSGSRSRKRSRKSAGNWRHHGQQKIDSARAKEIQTALIREHYLQGTATGTWDQASQRAMVKFQADHGWQTKVVPDSRALIKLGLGPNRDHLLNPESAMTGPIPSSTATARPDAPAITPAATDGANQPRQ